MSAATSEKIFVTALFVLIGLPPGLCSMYGTGAALSLWGRPGSQASQYAQLFVVPSLIGFAIFGLMLWVLIKTWRRKSP